MNIRKIVSGVLFVALWLAGTYFLRHWFWSVLAQLDTRLDVWFDHLSTTQQVLVELFRMSAWLPLSVAAYGGFLLLAQYGPTKLLVYPEAHILETTRQHSSGVQIARLIYFMVLVTILIPGSWVVWPYAAGPLVMLIAVAILSVQWIGAMAIGQTYKAKYGYKQGAIVPIKGVPVVMVILIFFFVLFTFGLVIHLTYFGAVCWEGAKSFGEARHQLLAEHGLILWFAAPFYFFHVNSRRVLLNFMLMNLWFIPLPRFAEVSDEFRLGGGTSGGAGATGSI